MTPRPITLLIYSTTYANSANSVIQREADLEQAKFKSKSYYDRKITQQNFNPGNYVKTTQQNFNPGNYVFLLNEKKPSNSPITTQDFIE